MEVKIDTKEKFHVITLPQTSLSATMTEELSHRLLPYLRADVANIVLNLKNLQSLDNISGETLVKIQQKFYENNASFVVCELQSNVEEFLDSHHLLEMMNTTPTESEAADIVKMEEIKRELMVSDQL